MGLMTLRISALHFSLEQILAGFCSWSHAGHRIARVRLRHLVRQPDIGIVGLGLRKPSAWGRTYHSGSGSHSKSSFERSLSSSTAAQASLLRGIIRFPASVLLLRTVSTLFVRSMSHQRRPRISPARIVVLSARVAATRAICHSGFDSAVFIRWSFSANESALWLRFTTSFGFSLRG